MSLARNPRQYTGVRPINPPNVVYADRAPTATDVAYVKGDLWLDLSGLASYQFAGSTWISLGSGSTGSVDTLTGGSGGAILPTAGNISLLGTANQITSTGSGVGHSITFSLPAALVAPGSVTATTTLTATLGAITATNGNLVLGTAGNKVSIATGANASAGVSGAMVGGAVTVATTAVTANSLIFASPATLGTVLVAQAYYISAKVAGTSFTITSADATDTSTWNYWILN